MSNYLFAGRFAGVARDHLLRSRSGGTSAGHRGVFAPVLPRTLDKLPSSFLSLSGEETPWYIAPSPPRLVTHDGESSSDAHASLLEQPPALLVPGPQVQAAESYDLG